MWMLAWLVLAQPVPDAPLPQPQVDTSRSIQAFGKDWTVFSAPKVLTVSDWTRGYPIFRDLQPAQVTVEGHRAVYRTRMHDGSRVTLTIEHKACRDEEGEELELHARLEAGPLRKAGCARYDEYPDIEPTRSNLLLGDLNLDHGIEAAGTGWTAQLGGYQDNFLRLEGRSVPVQQNEDFEASNPDIAGGRAVYRVRLTDGRQAVASLTPRPCRSGRQTVPLTIQLAVGGRRLAGCAKQQAGVVVIAPPPILHPPIPTQQADPASDRP